MSLLYAEVPCFYAELERARDPSLGGRPVVVGGDPRKRGLVQSATPDALAAGVEIGMPVLDALARCSGARPCRTNMSLYREAASHLRACFRRETDRIEPAGLEAAYLELESATDPPEVPAERLRRAVRAALRVPLRVGIAPVKFVARLAAEESGAAGIRRVEAHEVRRFLDPLPVGRLPGVGPQTEAALAGLGVRRAGELAALAPALVEECLGNHGLAVQAAARGQGDTRVRAAPHPRSVSQEVTLEADEVDLGVLEGRLRELAVQLERSLRLERLSARRAVLKIRYGDGENTTRTRTLERPLDSARDLGDLAVELLARTQAGARPVRLVGLGVSELRRAARDDRQLSLFER